jgi:hypothetical protein
MHISVVAVNPEGTGTPSVIMMLRLAPLPPSRSLSAFPSFLSCAAKALASSVNM